MRDPYRVLMVDPFHATAADIAKAFKQRAKVLHPDRETGSEEAFKELSQAYEILGDATRRQLWDEFGEASLRIGFNPEVARQALYAASAEAEARSTPDTAPDTQLYRPVEWGPQTQQGPFGSFGAFGPKGPGDM